jgi:hypothetical protein
VKTAEWIKFFERYREIKIFHITHIHLLTGMPLPVLRVSLKRLADKKLIKRICKGYYANPFNSPSLEEVASQIYSPSYISLESALSVYGILSQIPQVLTMISVKLPFRINTSLGRIEYRQVKKDFFWGFMKKNGYLIAEPEKAFLDYLYLNSRQITDFSELSFDVMKKSKIKKYAEKMHLKIEDFEKFDTK